MSLPFTSLNLASMVGAGSSRDLEGSFVRHTMVVEVTGAPTSVTVALEGSHDGITWRELGRTSQPQPIVSSTGHVVRHVRASVLGLSGGISPTVTATIASA